MPVEAGGQCVSAALHARIRRLLMPLRPTRARPPRIRLRLVREPTRLDHAGMTTFHFDNAFVREDQVEGKTLYRVRVGPIPSVNEFDKVVKRLRMLGFPDARLAVIAEAGLFSHEERPREVAAALLPTLLGDR